MIQFKELKIINAFVDEDNVLHVQFQIKGETCFEQEIVPLIGERN